MKSGLSRLGFGVFIFTLLLNLTIPLMVQANNWEIRREIREGAREVRRERREAVREILEADSPREVRREIREGIREVQRERREAAREVRREIIEDYFDD